MPEIQSSPPERKKKLTIFKEDSTRFLSFPKPIKIPWGKMSTAKIHPAMKASSDWLQWISFATAFNAPDWTIFGCNRSTFHGVIRWKNCYTTFDYYKKYNLGYRKQEKTRRHRQSTKRKKKICTAERDIAERQIHVNLYITRRRLTQLKKKRWKLGVFNK